MKTKDQNGVFPVFGLLLFSLCFPLSTFAFEGFPPGKLLFSGKKNGIWDLYFWNPELQGSQPFKPLTQTPQAEGNPIYWKRHHVFLCSVQEEGNRSSILVLSAKGEQIHKISDPSGNLGWPQPSPWDDRILTVREDPATGWTSVGVITYPDQTFVPFPETGSPGGQMAWISRDRIFVSRVNGGVFSLCEKNLKTNEEKVLLEDGRNWLSTSNPTGGAPFFFTRRIGQTSSIFQIKEEPTASRGWVISDFSKAKQYDWQPSVTPDGKRVIFQSLREGRFKPFIKSIESGEETQIPLEGFEEVFHPTWIPESSAQTP